MLIYIKKHASNIDDKYYSLPWYAFEMAQTRVGKNSRVADLWNFPNKPP